MRDERFPFRFEPLDIELHPVPERGWWEGTYGTGFTRAITVRWYRSMHDDSGCYEVSMRRPDGTISVRGRYRADNDTAWSLCRDAVHAMSERMFRELTGAEHAAQAARKADLEASAEEAVY
jgi:hypothetical protein